MTSSTSRRAAVTAQVFTEPAAENGLSPTPPRLLCFGPGPRSATPCGSGGRRNPAAAHKMLLHRSDYDNHCRPSKSPRRLPLSASALSKKDETSRLIERMVTRIHTRPAQPASSTTRPRGSAGNFNLYGVMSFVFIRSGLQLHFESGVRERKLPTLRTYARKIHPDAARPRARRRPRLGLWPGPRAPTARCIASASCCRACATVDRRRPSRAIFDILRPVFYSSTRDLLDPEHGYLAVRDEERTA